MNDSLIDIAEATALKLLAHIADPMIPIVGIQAAYEIAKHHPRAAEIDRAAHNADLLDDTFQDRADAFLHRFAQTHRTFTASRCTNAARLACVESPAHGAWGGVFIRAQKAGVIQRIGYAPRKNGNPAPLYCSRVFED